MSDTDYIVYLPMTKAFKKSDRLQSLLIDYKRLQNVGHRLQSLLIDYKRLQNVGPRL